MNLFARPEYESEFTQFLKDWKQRDPGLQQRQNAGRALLLDKAPLDPEQCARTKASAVKRRPYAYE